MKTLMYVRSVGEGSVELQAYDQTTGTIFQISAPQDVIRGLQGRQCWVEGAWGDKCKIIKWEPLPKFEEPVK